MHNEIGVQTKNTEMYTEDKRVQAEDVGGG